MARSSNPLTRTARERQATLRTWLKRLGIASACLAVLLFVAVFAIITTWPPINDVSTGETPEYPDLQPRAYAFTRERVFHATLEVIDADQYLTAVTSDLEAGTIEAEAVTPSGRWTDDVSVRVEPNGEGGAIVFVRSRSREGKWDFGQNARTIERLLASLDSRLAGNAATP